MDPAATDTVVKKRKIAVVEDNVELADVYKAKLEMNGYECLIAHDGIAALYLIQKEQPALVLLDLMVPNIAGDQILAKMRETPWGRNVPVVVISNLNEKDAPPGLRDYGISGYVVKAQLSLDQFGTLVDSMLDHGHLPTGVGQ